MTPPKKDITTKVKIEDAEFDSNVSKEIEKRVNEIPKFITVILITISMVVGTAVWATTQHSGIREWAVDQDKVMKIEIQKDVAEKYVPLHEFTKVKQSLDDQKKDLDRMEEKLDKVLDKLYRVSQ